MKLQPHVLRAASLWAEAQNAERERQWASAHNLYRQAVAIYDAVHDSSAAFRAYRRLCLMAKAQRDWAEMACDAYLMLEYSKRGIFWPESEPWLRIGQAERGCQHIETARQALIQCVRMSEASLTVFQIEAEEFPERAADDWTPEMGVYAEGLYEWGMLEAACGAVAGAIGLMTLAEYVLMRAEPFTMILRQDERKELDCLHQTIVADRLRLQVQL